LDGIVGCAVGASMQRAALENIAVPYRQKERVSFAEMQQRAKGRR
jgi:hypothetical protein